VPPESRTLGRLSFIDSALGVPLAAAVITGQTMVQGGHFMLQITLRLRPRLVYKRPPTSPNYMIENVAIPRNDEGRVAEAGKGAS